MVFSLGFRLGLAELRGNEFFVEKVIGVLEIIDRRVEEEGGRLPIDRHFFENLWVVGFRGEVENLGCKPPQILGVGVHPRQQIAFGAVAFLAVEFTGKWVLAPRDHLLELCGAATGVNLLQGWRRRFLGNRVAVLRSNR